MMEDIKHDIEKDLEVIEEEAKKLIVNLCSRSLMLLVN